MATHDNADAGQDRGIVHGRAEAHQDKAGFNVGHPAPDRGRVSVVRVFTGLLLAPAAWTVQLLVSYELANRICYVPGTATPGAPDWLGWVIGVTNGAALVLAAAATLLCYLNMRRTRTEDFHGSGGVLDAGEGRTRFLTVLGLFSGFIFLIAIVFNTLSLYLVPLCQA